MKILAVITVLLLASMFVACGSKKDGAQDTGTNAQIQSTVIDPGTITEDNAEKIADDTWVLTGRSEDFSFTNGGNIVNTAFIVTQAGVLVIDSGPSRAYGEQLRRGPQDGDPLVLVLEAARAPGGLRGRFFPGGRNLGGRGRRRLHGAIM